MTRGLNLTSVALVGALGIGVSFPTPVVTSVTLNNTAPSAGDTINATATGTDCASFSFRWKADGVAIAGATASDYTATRADAMGHTLTCEATGHNGGGAGVALASDPTAIVKGAPVCIVAPVATTSGANAPDGPATAGTDTLSVTDGTWTGFPVPIPFSYQWNGITTNDGFSPGSTNQNTFPIPANVNAGNVDCTVTFSGDSGASTGTAGSNSVIVITPA